MSPYSLLSGRLRGPHGKVGRPGRAELRDVVADQTDQDRGDRYLAGGLPGALLEAPGVVGFPDPVQPEPTRGELDDRTTWPQPSSGSVKSDSRRPTASPGWVAA